MKNGNGSLFVFEGKKDCKGGYFVNRDGSLYSVTAVEKTEQQPEVVFFGVSTLNSEIKVTRVPKRNIKEMCDRASAIFSDFEKTQTERGGCNKCPYKNFSMEKCGKLWATNKTENHTQKFTDTSVFAASA